MLPIENSFIFPGLDKFSVLPVLEQADARSIVILSGVNREACQFLSNDVYFKRCVAIRFSRLMALGFSFPLLCETHPTNCWKFLSCSSGGEGSLALNETVLKVRLPFLCRELESKKARVEAQIQEICGSRYEDPDSPIHQLWLEFKRADRDMHKMMEDLQNNEHWLNVNRTFALAHEGPGLCVVMRFLNSHSGLLAPGQEEELLAEAYNNQVPLRQDLLSCYRDWYFFYKKDVEATDRRHRCFEEYLGLESDRREYCNTQKACNDEIAELQDPSRWMRSDSMGMHQLNLSGEFDIAIRVEKQLEVAALCIQLIDQIEQGQLKETSEACNQILDIICSPYSLELKWYVLEELFESREVDTERFIAAFPQCLPQLRSILSSIPKEVFFGKN
jgi:hypothetical protein